MTIVRVKFSPLGTCRIDMQTFVYITKTGGYSYLLVCKSPTYNYFLTLHRGQVEVEKHGVHSEFMNTLKAYSRCDLKHAAEIYLKSTLPKTDEALEILDRIQFSPLDRSTFFDKVPVERERKKKVRLTKKEKITVKANTISLEKICEDLGISPSAVRARFRRAKTQKPGSKWAWPKSQVPEIMKMIKGLMKMK